MVRKRLFVLPLVVLVFLLVFSSLILVGADVGDTGYVGYKGGGGADAISVDGFYGTLVYLPVRANITGLAAYYKANSGDHPGRMAIYSADGQTCYYGSLDDEGTVESYIWHNWTSANFVTLNAGYYLLGVRMSTGGLYYNVTTGGSSVFYGVSAEVDANGPMSLTYNAYKWCVYMNYTETGLAVVTSTETSNLSESWFVFGFILLLVVVTVLPLRLFLLRFGLGLFGVVLAASQLGNSDLLFYPWILIVWLFLSVVVIMSSFARRD